MTKLNATLGQGLNLALLRTLTLILLTIVVTSCATRSKFPISIVTPAADIVAIRSHDQNGNAELTITAKNLAAVDRIASPKKAYVVWIVTESEGVKNIGKLVNKNTRTVKLKTLISDLATEVFITAEEDGDALYPGGVEISRIQFPK